MFARVELARVHALFTKVSCWRQRAKSDVKKLKKSYSRVCGSAYYLGHRRRCGCSSRRCSGSSRGTWRSRTGRPRRSRLPRGSLNPGPCSSWPRWSMSHPYGHPDEEEELLKKRKNYRCYTHTSTCMQPTNPLLTWLSAVGKPPT